MDLINLIPLSLNFSGSDYLATFAGGVLCGVYFGGRMYASGRMRRFLVVNDIPNHFFAHERKIKGRVVSVTDGDTLRLRHAPSLNLFGPSVSKDASFTDTTLQIRLAGIDTPETAKFGKEGQPLADTAKKRLTDLVLGKVICVQLLSKDQYSRAVGEVYVRPIELPLVPRLRNAANVMLSEGLGVVYQQSGAVYGQGYKGEKRKQELLNIEGEAKNAKRGIWAIEGETPAQFKARMKADDQK
eukprot:c2349_g1_i1.p1 GENE.c2349_g1_i1~~c2349_g1_i1.p1  ORF type:complete len:242 (+),score=27.06 c2349_g1_i1:28-753(+)